MGAEPGYYKSIKNASHYAAYQLGESLSIECYQKIHHIACNHFSDVNPCQINVDKQNIENFRNLTCSCARIIGEQPYEYDTEKQLEIRKQEFLWLQRARVNLIQQHGIKSEVGDIKEMKQALSPELRE